MKLKLEDEAEGDHWNGYVSIEIIDDHGDLVVDANVAPECVPDVDKFIELFDVLGDYLEDDDPPGPGGSVL